MKKQSIIIITIVAALIVIISCLIGTLIKNSKETTIPNEIVITQYEPGTNTQIKRIRITSPEEIKKVKKYINKIKPLSDKEMINLALLQEVVIDYGKSISVGIQLDEEIYCYYKDEEKNISSLAKNSHELYKWVKEKINN